MKIKPSNPLFAKIISLLVSILPCKGTALPAYSYITAPKINAANKTLSTKKILILPGTLTKHLDPDKWDQSLPTSPPMNILNHITLLQNCSLPLIPLIIFLQMLNQVEIFPPKK